ncbi:MAG: RNA polymerase sigma factor [Caldisericaceae bacterium]|nr:RNA polymerase sigma factor [Caldisericaceae bacterium]
MKNLYNFIVQSDKEILKDSLVHSEVFGIVYERYHNKIFSHIYRLTQDVQVTEDLTEETFLQVIKKRKRIIRSEAPFEHYIYRMATNNALRYFRDEERKRKAYNKLYTKQSIKDSISFPGRNGEKELIKAINNLPRVKRICIIMYYIEDKNIQEIAVTLDKGVSTISDILKKARKDLYDTLRKNWGERDNIYRGK